MVYIFLEHQNQFDFQVNIRFLFILVSKVKLRCLQKCWHFIFTQKKSEITSITGLHFPTFNPVPLSVSNCVVVLYYLFLSNYVAQKMFIKPKIYQKLNRILAKNIVNTLGVKFTHAWLSIIKVLLIKSCDGLFL